MTRREDGARSMSDMLNDGERDVLTLWDSGATINQIAAATGRSRDYVGKVLSRFSPSPAELAFDAMVARGSAALAVAIAATGKTFA